ncbi:hypothetical protein GCM10016234_36320 [Tianweitania populi]|uniref:Uncharacterized protein n=1 Tax=Tianweitania populi TaxID=1607949 RepID=A0A8J3DT19_9HYPH|nr:hypothetical protein GCM10016234_36320 [Tianweitania populi]
MQHPAMDFGEFVLDADRGRDPPEKAAIFQDMKETAQIPSDRMTRNGQERA